jgi:uncharacterized protein
MAADMSMLPLWLLHATFDICVCTKWNAPDPLLDHRRFLDVDLRPKRAMACFHMVKILTCCVPLSWLQLLEADASS